MYKMSHAERSPEAAQPRTPHVSCVNTASKFIAQPVLLLRCQLVRQDAHVVLSRLVAGACHGDHSFVTLSGDGVIDIELACEQTLEQRHLAIGPRLMASEQLWALRRLGDVRLQWALAGKRATT